MYQTQLPTAQLGRTGLQITRVGFGAWALGGGDWEHGWGPQEDDAVAVAWTLHNLAVDGAIVGCRRPDRVDPILAAANLVLTEQDIDDIEGETR